MAAKPSTPEPEPIERWTAQRKAAIILDVLKGQISVLEAARKYGFAQNEYRRWADEYHRAGVEALKVNRKDQDAKYDRDQAAARENRSAGDGRRYPAGGDASFSFGRSDVERVVVNGKRARQRACRPLNVPRSTSYYRRRQRTLIVDELLAQRIKRLIDDEPYPGYRMVWARLRMQGHVVNRKTVQRIMQLKGWQCHRRLKKRCSPRVESSVSVTRVSNVRWATDAPYIWTTFEGLVYFNGGGRLPRSRMHRMGHLPAQRREGSRMGA